MKNLLEVMKANKKAIVKKTLIIGGTLAGIAIAVVMVNSKTDGALEDMVGEFVDDIEIEVGEFTE